MKIEIGVVEQDESTLHYLFCFENGLVLKTHHTPLPFAGKETKEKIVAQVKSLIEEFKLNGHEVTGQLF